MKLSFHKKCTCGHKTEDDNHYFSCDLWYMPGKSFPRKHKQFGIFYPMKVSR